MTYGFLAFGFAFVSQPQKMRGLNVDPRSQLVGSLSRERGELSGFGLEAKTQALNPKPENLKP